MSLDISKIIVSLAAGVPIWYGVARLLGTMKPCMHAGSGHLPVVYAGVAAATYPTIWLVSKSMDLSKGEVLPSIALIIGSASILDGLMLTYGNSPYGGDELEAGSLSRTAHGRLHVEAALILFGVGTFLIAAALHPGAFAS